MENLAPILIKDLRLKDQTTDPRLGEVRVKTASNYPRTN